MSHRAGAGADLGEKSFQSFMFIVFKQIVIMYITGL